MGIQESISEAARRQRELREAMAKEAEQLVTEEAEAESEQTTAGNGTA